MYQEKIAKELALSPRQVQACIQLLDEGATVPFIARYRKEKTGSMEDIQITQVRDRLQQLRDLDQRRETILKSIDEQGKLTSSLRDKIEAAETMTVLEDLYLPYRPKRRTRASIAREKGLEPLADAVLKQQRGSVEDMASPFVDVSKDVPSIDEALQGARDIIAEVINEDAEARAGVRVLFEKYATITSKVLKGKEKDGEKYRDYFDMQESLAKVPSHRLLAMRRGEKEMFLSLDIAPDEPQAIRVLENKFLSGNSASTDQVRMAVADAYKRLMKPSLETEARLWSKKKADEEAIQVFSENLKQLLMSAPLGQRSVLALDPGFRTGCKLVCLDRQGKLLEQTKIFPNAPQKDTRTAGETVRHLVSKHKIEAIAIGNGTASRETEQFVRNIGLDKGVTIAVVSESGASVYSASEVARAEFPNEDVTVRGAVSIGRRLMDPLAELVKIDPKSIGVGQYQHDVDQSSLKKSLDDVVESCVNAVGVELNTASKELLTYVSGLGPQLAANIVEFRDQHGPIANREQLKKVPRLGAKAFEQAAGFLRIRESGNPLDQSAVHPESYGIVRQMAKDINSSVKELMDSDALRKRLDLERYISDSTGMPTLKDIMTELDKPGRDPRADFKAFSFAEDITEIEHLTVGMKLPGIVTNITKFGAFVDVGVHQDGLVHISHLSDSFVSDPAKVVSLHQQVAVTVTEVDIARRRISLSLKSDPFGKTPERKKPAPRKKSQAPQKEGRAPDGELQAKLAALKGKFNS